MKILQKQNIIETISSLYVAHCKLRYGKINSNLEILSDCQTFAISIGNILEEEVFDQYREIVSKLEKYCEMLYIISLPQDSESTWNVNILDINHIINRIKVEVELNVQADLYEVVFMPYNASMWDTFDSVYHEAINDNRCNVVVMPIPFYNIGKDGNMITEEYEGNRMPDSISVTSYKEYDISKKKPDVIFIHNPYDSYNKVTRVPEKYYSSELIKHTEHLVYIPYYISDEKTSEYFCYMPGVKNAWRVFVQSEIIKQQYDRWNPSEKIVALGSPKADMLLKQNSENAVMPKEWESTLINRKVFLYNTHLQNIINKPDVLIKKLKYVFSMVKNRSDIAIIWRPHPLSIATLKSLSEDLLNEYMLVIDEFNTLSNGIYDDTSDLYRSISLSDAYIGDSCSSVVKLYGTTGKPMFFLDEINLLDVNCKKYIRTISPVINGDDIYMFSWEYNALYGMNINSRTSKFITSFSNEENMKQNLYTAAVECDKKIYYSPCNAKQMAIYNIELRSIEYITLNREEESNEYNLVKIENKLYLLPIFYSSNAFCIDTQTNAVTTIQTNYNQNFSNFKNLGVVPLFYGNVIVNDKIWRVCRVGSFVQVYDYVKGIFDYYEIKCSIKAFRDITYDGKDFWLLSNNNENIVKWNPKSNIVNEINIYAETEDTNSGLLYNMICYEKKFIWLIPQLSNEIIKIDVDNSEINKLSYNTVKGFKKDHNNAKAFNNYKIYNNQLLLFPYRSNSIISIDMDTNVIEAIQMDIPKDKNEFEWIEYITHGNSSESDICNNSHTYEERVCSLWQFIHIVKNSLDIYEKQRTKYYSNNINNVDGSCGKKIWEYIIEQLKIV